MENHTANMASRSNDFGEGAELLATSPNELLPHSGEADEHYSSA